MRQLERPGRVGAKHSARKPDLRVQAPSPNASPLTMYGSTGCHSNKMWASLLPLGNGSADLAPETDSVSQTESVWPSPDYLTKPREPRGMGMMAGNGLIS